MLKGMASEDGVDPIRNFKNKETTREKSSCN
jgi:hypothetical protein